MTSEQQTMSETECAICGDTASSTEIYPPAFRADKTVKHGRIVRCDRCGLMRTDPAAGVPASSAPAVPGPQLPFRHALDRLRQLGAGTAALLVVGAESLVEDARTAGF